MGEVEPLCAALADRPQAAARQRQVARRFLLHQHGQQDVAPGIIAQLLQAADQWTVLYVLLAAVGSLFTGEECV